MARLGLAMAFVFADAAALWPGAPFGSFGAVLGTLDTGVNGSVMLYDGDATCFVASSAGAVLNTYDVQDGRVVAKDSLAPSDNIVDLVALGKAGKGCVMALNQFNASIVHGDTRANYTEEPVLVRPAMPMGHLKARAFPGEGRTRLVVVDRMQGLQLYNYDWAAPCGSVSFSSKAFNSATACMPFDSVSYVRRTTEYVALLCLDRMGPVLMFANAASGTQLSAVRFPPTSLGMSAVGLPWQRHADNESLVAAAFENGVAVINASNASAPAVVGSFFATRVSDIAFAPSQRDVLFVCAEEGVLRVDIANLTAPTVAETVAAVAPCTGLQFANGSLYVMHGTSLTVVAVPPPASGVTSSWTGGSTTQTSSLATATPSSPPPASSTLGRSISTTLSTSTMPTTPAPPSAAPLTAAPAASPAPPQPTPGPPPPTASTLPTASDAVETASPAAAMAAAALRAAEWEVQGASGGTIAAGIAVATSAAGGATGSALFMAVASLPCKMGDEDPAWYPRSLAPLQLEVDGSRAVGAVLGNLAIAGGVGLVGWGVAAAARRRRAAFDDADAWALFPALPLRLFLLVYQGTLLGCLDVLVGMAAAPVPAQLAATAALLGCLAVPVCAVAEVKRHVPSAAYVRLDPAACERVPSMCARVRRALIGDSEWVSRARSLHWVRRMGSFVVPYRMGAAYYAAVECAAAVAVAAMQCARPEDLVGCGHIKAAVGCVLWALVALEAALRPHLVPRNNALDGLILTAQAAAMWLSAAYYYEVEGGESWLTAAGVAQTAGLGVLGVKGGCDAAAWVVVVCSGRRARLQSDQWAETDWTLRGLTGDDDSEFEAGPPTSSSRGWGLSSMVSVMQTPSRRRAGTEFEETASTALTSLYAESSSIAPAGTPRTTPAKAPSVPVRPPRHATEQACLYLPPPCDASASLLLKARPKATSLLLPPLSKPPSVFLSPPRGSGASPGAASAVSGGSPVLSSRVRRCSFGTLNLQK